MEFRLFEKCAKVVLNRGKIFNSLNLILDFNREIQELENGKPYKYLGLKKLKAYNIKK